MLTLGFCVNPFAGIGGKGGLKGSDGADIIQKALAMGAQMESGTKTLETLEIIKKSAVSIEILTCSGAMRANILQTVGLPYRIVSQCQTKQTTAEDTTRDVLAMKAEGADLILFAGGDGTARNVLDAVGDSMLVLGIPTGCKIHSAVYALNPRSAGELTVELARGAPFDITLSEVMDINETLFRQGIVDAQLYGYLKVPHKKNYMQRLKSGGELSEVGVLSLIGNSVIEQMKPDVLYVMGTGSTIHQLMAQMNLQGSLLGIDLILNGKLIAVDVTEQDILDAFCIHPKRSVIVYIIGSQGYVFGRGNQQLSAQVLQQLDKKDILIVANKQKMNSLFGSPLYVDTGDKNANKRLCGYYKVLVGYNEFVMAKLTS